MKKSILLPSATVVVAILLFFLRSNQLSVAKDPETLLYAPGAMETTLVMVVLFGALAILGLFLLSGGRELPNYTYTVYCPRPFFMATVVIAAFVLLMSLVIGFMDFSAQYSEFQANQSFGSQESFPIPWALLFTLLASCACGFVMLYLGRLAYRGMVLQEAIYVTLPAYMSCVHLMSSYRDLGSVANLQDSVYPVVGSVFLTLALYHLAATAYVDARPRKIIFFSLGSVLFSGVTLASGRPVYDSILLFSLNLYLLAFSAAVIENTYCTREAYRTPPTPEELENLSQQT